jgi:RNA polymerase sigma factor (sigma-70 family)
MEEHQFKAKIVPLSHRLYNICFRMLGDPDEAKDCLQDVFLKLWAGKESLDSIRSIEAYATTVARNLCLDRLRIKKNNVCIEKAFRRDDIIDETRLQEPDERLELLGWALKHLSEIQVKIFTMRDIERMDYGEIANELNLNQENVRVILSRARKRIREIIEQRTRNK